MKSKNIKDFRVCIIGLGTIGSRYVRVFSENFNPKSVAIHDLDEAKSRQLAQQYNVKSYDRIESMFERETPDIVIVATPDHAHEDPVKLALESNASVLVEKPLATDLKAAVEMVELAEEIIDFWAENALEHERVGETIDRIGLVNFLEGIEIDVDPNMMNSPRVSNYVRMDEWDQEAEKWKARQSAG